MLLESVKMNDETKVIIESHQKEIEELRKQLGEGADYEGEDGENFSDEGEEYVDENGKVVRQKKSKLSLEFSLQFFLGSFDLFLA